MSEQVRAARTCGLDGDVYEDREGERYTTCPVAAEDDPWRGATILTPGVVNDLRNRGLLPLREVVRPTWADQDIAQHPKPWLRRILRFGATRPSQDAAGDAGSGT